MSAPAEFRRWADAELDSSEQGLRDVRAILADAAARLLAGLSRVEDGGDAEAIAALQFQDISDQLLAHAMARIAAVRSQLGEAPVDCRPGSTAPARPVLQADLVPGSAELFENIN